MTVVAVGTSELVQAHPHTDARRGIVFASTAALLICSNGPSAYLLLHVFNRGGGGHAWITLYPFTAVAVVGVVCLARRLHSESPRTWPFVIFALGAYVGWALLSAVWSVSSEITATNALIGVGIAAFGCWFGWCLTIAEQIWSVMIATSTAVVASAIVIVFLPQYGRMLPNDFPDDYWQGIFGNRNSLAPMCVLGLIALAGFVALKPRPKRILVSVALAIVHVILLRGSGGATSLAALGLAGFVATLVPAVWLLRRLGVRGLVVGAVTMLGAIGATVWILVNVDRVASWMDRSTTLTGRRPIWADVREFIQVHPVRGYGFWAFWERADLTAASYSRLNYAYGSAHNSVLEVLLGLGVIGLVFYLAVVFSAIVGVAVFVWMRPSLGAWWWATVLAFLIVQNAMESFVLWHSYNWVLFIASAFVLFGKHAGDEDSPVPLATTATRMPDAPSGLPPQVLRPDATRITAQRPHGSHR